MQGCNGWEFESGLCREHHRAKPEFIQIGNKCVFVFFVFVCAGADLLPPPLLPNRYKDAEPMQPGLCVANVIDSPHYLTLQQGDRVDLLDVLRSDCREKGVSLVQTAPNLPRSTLQRQRLGHCAHGRRQDGLL